MRDPHVVALYYKLKHSSRVAFNNPPPLNVASADFNGTLANGELKFSLRSHYSTRDSAREVVDPFLRSWELKMALDSQEKDIWFEFDRAEIIDRNPPGPGETYVAPLEGGSYLIFGCDAALTATRNAYPPPDPNFVASPFAEAMWNRYEQYRKGREPLPGMAYACLTFLEGTTGLTAGARAAICAKYSIAKHIRDTLGDLISEKGDLTEARKLGASATGKPFTDKEREWIQAVVRALIRRKGEYDADPTGAFPQITMSDLPKL